MNKEDQVIVVDENDIVIGYKNRSDRNPEDIIRISGIWIENEKNEVLISQRSLAKKNNPGKWGPAAAGTLERGETYLSNALKEVGEEIGISLNEGQIIFLGSFYRESSHKYFAGTFFAQISSCTKFILQTEEVADVRWVSLVDLKREITEYPDNFLLNFNDGILKRIIDWKHCNKKML